MSDIVEETFAQENIPDVEGSIAAFFLGWCGKRASEDSVDEGCEPLSKTANCLVKTMTS